MANHGGFREGSGRKPLVPNPRDQIISILTQKRALVEEAKRRYYLTRLYEFNLDIVGWPDLDEFHKELCSFVETGKNKKLILVPRGHLKSSVITVGYALREIVKNPGIRILIANATYQMAKNFLTQIKHHLQKNEKLRAVYGDLSTNADKWSESAITVVAPNEAYLEKKEPTVTVFGIGGNLTGQHYDLILMDDLVNRENIGTEDQIEKVKQFYKDCQPLLDVGGRMVIIGTRWDYNDLYGWILDEPNVLSDFDIMVRQAYEGDWRVGKILFPKKFTWEIFEEIKRQMGSADFSCQYLNLPVDAETAPFKRKWFKYYEQSDLKGTALNTFTTVDPAISQEKSADYTAIVTVGVDQYNNWYILDIIRERLNPLEIINKLFLVYQRWYPLEMGIELVSFQKTIKFFLLDEMRKRNLFLPIKELKPDARESKELRIKGLIPRYETGTIFHPKEAAFTEVLENELVRFPKSVNDDVIDSLAYQLQLTFPSKRKVSVKQNRYLY